MSDAIKKTDQHILDCYGMLDAAIRRGDKEDIAFWRRMLQSNKNIKRRLKTT